MEVAIVTRSTMAELVITLETWLKDGWKFQGGLVFGDGQWAVLLVKEKEEEQPQYPYEPERTMAYQEVAKQAAIQRLARK